MLNKLIQFESATLFPLSQSKIRQSHPSHLTSPTFYVKNLADCLFHFTLIPPENIARDMPNQATLSRREREIMDVIYAHENTHTGCSVNHVLAEMKDPPGRTAVRTLLRILEEKGHLKHRKAGREYIYRPTQARHKAGKSALRHVLETFFNGSLEQAVAAHIADPGLQLTKEETERLTQLIKSHADERPKP